MTDEHDEQEYTEDERPASLIGGASADALDLIEERIEAEGGKLLAGFVVVHADGVSPNGGVFFGGDEDDGPQTAQDRLAFLLAAVNAFAEQQGIPMAVLDMPGGQPNQG